MSVKITGVQEFKKQINNILLARIKKAERAATIIGLKVKGDAVRLAPNDLGNLRGSAYSRIENNLGVVSALVGFSAEYALYVHEDLEMKTKGQGVKRPKNRGTRWDNGESKFLEKAVIRNREFIRKTIKESQQ